MRVAGKRDFPHFSPCARLYRLRVACHYALLRAGHPVAGPRLAPPTAQQSNGHTYTGHDPQIAFLMAEAGKAFTTFEAFFAATFTSLPNIILLPAGRAGLCFSFSITT